MGLQAQVNQQPAVGVVGDFADTNITVSMLSGVPNGLVAAPSPRGPIVGNFAWGDLATGKAYGRNYGESSVRIGFLHREQQAIIVDFLAERALTLQAGLILTLATQGSFWASFAAAAAVGQKVFARYLDGSVYAAAAGTSTQTASVTASLASTGVLTVSAVGSGALAVGAVLTGVNIPAGVAITAQLSGTAGGTGTYQTTGTVVGASATVLAFESVETSFEVTSPVDADFVGTGAIDAAGVLTVSAVTSGVVAIGQELQRNGGSIIPRATRIVGFISGTGGTGTYRTNLQVGPVVASGAIRAFTGRLAKISSWS